MYNKFEEILRSRSLENVGTVGFHPAITALKIHRVLAAITLLIAAFMIWTHLDHRTNPFLYTEVNGTHTMTATALLGFSIALFLGGVFHRPAPVPTALYALVLLLCVARLMEFVVFLHEPVTHAFDLVFSNNGLTHVRMGGEYGDLSGAVELGALLRRWHASVAFVVVIFGLILPSVAALGYSYRHADLYDMMSPFTTAMLLMVGTSKLLVFVRSPFLRPFMTTSHWAVIARRQIAFFVVGVWSMGYFIEMFAHVGAVEILVGGVIWLFVGTFLLSGPVFERSDHARRQLEREAMRAATIDPLTGLLNRRAVQSIQVRSDAERRTTPASTFGVILCDIDHFKSVNDTAGHEVGDAVLYEVAQCLRGHVRSSDLVARWGGEEFVIILPSADVAGAMIVAEKLRKAVSSTVAWTHRGTAKPVTLSFGVSSYDETGPYNLEASIYDADTALYLAKTGGRNRVVQAKDRPVVAPPTQPFDRPAPLLH